MSALGADGRGGSAAAAGNRHRSADDKRRIRNKPIMSAGTGL